MDGVLIALQLGIDPQQLGIEFGSGAVIGGIIGFAAKKVAKIIAIIVGLELALFKFLESRGILTVDWAALSAGVLKTGENAAGGMGVDHPLDALRFRRLHRRLPARIPARIIVLSVVSRYG